MEAAWMMLQQDKADDYVIATGEAHSVAEFVQEAFGVVNLDPSKYVKTSDEFMRPTKTSALVGDSRKANGALGFQPKTRFRELVKIMVDADLQAQRGLG